MEKSKLIKLIAMVGETAFPLGGVTAEAITTVAGLVTEPKIGTDGEPVPPEEVAKEVQEAHAAFLEVEDAATAELAKPVADATTDAPSASSTGS